tara:strand:+ start:227 stop:1429 length:1203 start_codon:yes stop_codon:yes gene_type:complete
MSAKQFLLSIDSKIIKYGLDRTKQLLKACNNPHLKLNIIQVVGTNGKGSTSAMLSNVLINNNYSTGLYTSPHLVNINERIRVNHVQITNSFMDDFISQYKNDLLFIKPSFFEIMTVMALCYFVKHKVDFAILETGLGGRLDSVTATLAKTVIFTPIDIDHIPLLGNDLHSIAREKAGAILKNTVSIFSSKQYKEVSQILDKRAKKFNNHIHYNDMLEQYNLHGSHQRDNANLVKYVLTKLIKTQGLKLQKITFHLEQTIWPGRIQFIQKNPDIIFDVAHNEHSIKAFIKYFLTIKNNYEHRKLIIGFEEGKKIEKVLNRLTSLFDNVIITETKIRNSMNPNFISSLCSHSMQEIELNPKQAVQKSIQNMNSNDLVVILGSHYFGPYIFSLFKNSFDMQQK